MRIRLTNGGVMVFWESVADELHGHGFKTRNGTQDGDHRVRQLPTGHQRLYPSGLGTGPSGAVQTWLTKGKGYLPLFPTPPAPSITSLYSRDSAAGLLQLPPTGRAPESIVLWSSPGPLGKAA